jgi:hypothetical protein
MAVLSSWLFGPIAPVVCVGVTARLFHDAQLNVDITHATINSIGRFIDRLARMKATIGYGASYNRVLPRVREVRPDPCSLALMRWRSS